MPDDQPNLPHLQDLVRALRRRLPIILVCALAGPAVAAGYTALQEKKYSASATLLFRSSRVDQQLFGIPAFIPRDPKREAATNEGLVSLRAVARRTARRLAPRITYRHNVAVRAQGESDLVAVTATDPEPAVAARVANVFAEEYISFRRAADRKSLRTSQRLVRRTIRGLTPTERRSQRGQILREQAEQLATLARLQTGNAELVQRAAPPGAPSSPRPARNLMIGTALGLLLGFGLALLLERFDRRLRDPNDVEELFAKPILGAIPASKSLPKAPLAIGGQEADAFRMLRANLRYFNVDREIKSLLVTSAAPGDGKSTVAWNLGLVAAASGSRVLLIEADMRHPVFASRYGITAPAGLGDVLAEGREISGAVVQVPVAPPRNATPPPTMDVLVAGPTPPNATDLLESERARQLLRTAEQTYDLVIIDTPPTSVVPDAIPLLTRVSGILVVIRLAKTTRPPALHLRTQLDNLGAPMLGVVLNSLTHEAGGYYGYGYGDYYTPRDGQVTAPPAPPPPADPSPPPQQLAREDAGAAGGGETSTATVAAPAAAETAPKAVAPTGLSHNSGPPPSATTSDGPAGLPAAQSLRKRLRRLLS